uniref:Uncharacterized protein n=1 Tax=Cacopsylla melanoneura TaxID=428564 RepID=A0A8D8SLZ1_9HEMI
MLLHTSSLITLCLLLTVVNLGLCATDDWTPLDPHDASVSATFSGFLDKDLCAGPATCVNAFEKQVQRSVGGEVKGSCFKMADLGSATVCNMEKTNSNGLKWVMQTWLVNGKSNARTKNTYNA